MSHPAIWLICATSLFLVFCSRNLFNQFVFNQSVFNQSMFNQSVFNKSMFNQSAFNQSAFNQSVFNQCSSLHLIVASAVFLHSFRRLFTHFNVSDHNCPLYDYLHVHAFVSSQFRQCWTWSPKLGLGSIVCHQGEVLTGWVSFYIFSSNLSLFRNCHNLR